MARATEVVGTTGTDWQAMAAGIIYHLSEPPAPGSEEYDTGAVILRGVRDGTVDKTAMKLAIGALTKGAVRLTSNDALEVYNNIATMVRLAAE